MSSMGAEYQMNSYNYLCGIQKPHYCVCDFSHARRDEQVDTANCFKDEGKMALCVNFE
jgi:hypothetical protein